MKQITRASVANITPEGMALKVCEHNDAFPGAPISATVIANIGITPAWGIEAGVTLETTAPWDVFAVFLKMTLRELGEECAFLTTSDNKCFLFYADGAVEAVE